MHSKSTDKGSPLSELKIGKTGIISNVLGKGALRQRLLDMGLTRGAKVQIIKYAPLGDPMEISVRGYSLIIRKSEAANILL